MQYLRNVVTLKIDSNLCTGCGMCAIVCPHAVFKIHSGKAQIVDIDDCMECGACSNNCRLGALTVKSGVGCAAGILNGILNGTEPTCDCGGESKGSCC
jgi:NAD-dependent dihydropyrimidine dehydrogenase PreA subunit